MVSLLRTVILSLILSYCRVIPIMVRNYKKKTGNAGKCNYKPVHLENAIRAVRIGKMSIRKASEQYAIPYTTLNDKLKNKYKHKVGAPRALSEREEKQLSEGLMVCANWGFPLKRTDVLNVVQGYLNRAGRVEKRFKNNRPGIEWFHNFMDRNKILSERMSENTKRVRASITRKSLAEFYENLHESMSGIPASNVINYDETNFCDDPGQSKVIVKRGVKHAMRILDTSKTSISVMFAAAGNGTVLPPFTVYRSTHLYDTWTDGGVEGAGYGRSKSGWFDLQMFEEWFLKILLPYARKLQGAKIMIGDNLSSHISLNVIKLCAEHGIKFILLPPNTTHLCQPLDIAFFRPLKIAWRGVLENWKKTNRGVIPKSDFPRLLKQTLDEINVKSADNVKSGFKKAGIMPFCPEKVLSQLPDSDDGEEKNEEDRSWTDSFVQHLKETRFESSSNKNQTARRKRLNVPPGKALVVRNLTSDNTHSETENSEHESTVSETDSSSTLSETESSDKETPSSDPKPSTSYFLRCHK